MQTIILLRRAAAMAIVVLAVLVHGNAISTVLPPVRVSLDVDPDQLPVPGEIYRFTLEFDAAESIDLVTADLQSDRDEHGVRYWEVVSFPAPVEVLLVPGSPLRIDCEVLCNDATQPLYVAYRLGSFSDRTTFYLLPSVTEVAQEIDDESKGAMPAIDTLLERPDPDLEPATAPKDHPRYERQEPVPAGADALDGAIAGDDGAKQVNRNAYGRFTYRRNDDKLVGCDGCTVRLYDENAGADLLLGAVTTDPAGYYSIDFVWPWSGDPDLYVVFEANNSKVKVARPAPSDPFYKWTSGTKWNTPGASVNMGWLAPLADDHRAVLHQLSSLTRNWRMLYDMDLGFIGKVTLRMPDSDWPHYRPAVDTIFLPNSPDDWSWADGVIWHEYGHHIISLLGDSNSTDYCNPGDRCDEQDEDCRHCLWCEETAADAWNEGFPDYIADLMTRIISSNYNLQYGTGQATNGWSFETNNVCSFDFNGFNVYDDPSKTEGILAALLRDLDDGAPDIDQIGNGLGQDLTSYGHQTVIQVALLDQPTTPWEYINAFVARYPGDLPAIWSTAYNNGYNIDQTPPGIVTTLTSPSHPTNGQSSDATIDYTWNHAPDNAAGIGGYSVWIGPAPALPDQTADIGAVTSLETGILSPATYWFSIRAVDKAGNWSTGYATHGPITIREPFPADMTPLAGPNFAHPVVPRNALLTFYGIAPEPASLSRSPVYLNLSVRNVGESATAGAFNQRSWIDGVNAGFGAVPSDEPVEPQEFRYHMNLGPYSAPGGRHTLSLMADGGEDLAEWSEYNNFYAAQWIFAPHLVSAGTPFVAPPPVRRFAGWRGTEPLFQSPNCTGLRLDAAGAAVSAMVVMALATDDDYDIRSHAMSLGALSGFHNIGSYAYSMRDTACIDAVLVVPEAAFAQVWDVGVLNANPISRVVQESDFQARKVDSIELPFGSPHVEAWEQNEALSLFHYDFNGRIPQPRVIEVFADPATGPLHVGLYAEVTDHAALTDHIIVAHTDENGRAAISFTVEAGVWPIVVWRDPRDAPGGQLPLAATSFSVEVRERRPDLQPAWLAGWHAPLVPRPAADGSPGTVPAPASLLGDATATWLNAAIGNVSPQPADPVHSRQYLDGTEIASQVWGVMAGGGVVTWNAPSPLYVHAGRHTLALGVDPADLVEEENEANNSFASQWSWRAMTLPIGTAVTRAAPPAPTGGWPELMASNPVAVFFNADGVRMPPPAPSGDDGHWLALAAMPAGTSDVDLRLHEAEDNALDGFGDPLTASVAGTGQADYVLVNFRATQPQSFDVGVVGSAGTDDYLAAVVASTFLDAEPEGNHGPFELEDGRWVALHEVSLAAGPLQVTLTNVSGTVDWGLALHRANLPLQSRSTPMAGGEAWTAGPAEAETISLEIPEAGHYCLAVWKVFAADVGQNGRYALDFGTGGTDVPPASLPAQTAITGASPNPFNPRTVIHFDLAKPGHVELSLYDVRGRAVRKLVSEVRVAGRHTAVWDGTDHRGLPATSGVYVVRLAAAGTTSQRKLMLIK